MAGAYTAKPAVAATPDPPIESRPPGWDDFTFPFDGSSSPAYPFDGGESGLPGSGAHPPGYEPDYSLVMTATAEIAPDGTATVTGSLRDHSTYATGEPGVITWTATIDGEAVNLRFSEGEYASSISSDCAFATYWGAAPSIEFELTDENDGDTVVLTGTSIVDEETVTETAEVGVAIVTIAKVVVTFTMSAIDQGENYWITEVSITNINDTLFSWLKARIEGLRLVRTRFLVSADENDRTEGKVTLGPYVDYAGGLPFYTDGAVSWTEDGSLTMTFLEDGDYGIGLYVFTDGYNDSTIVANAKFYDSEDNLISEYDATATVNVPDTTFWLEFSTATNEITEIPVL